MKPRTDFLPAFSLLLFLALFAALVMYLSQQPLRPLPPNAPAADFSAERAFRHVEALSREPRPVGTDAHARACSYIMGELQALGLDPQIQSATVVSRPGGTAGTAESKREAGRLMTGVTPSAVVIILG